MLHALNEPLGGGPPATPPKPPCLTLTTALPSPPSGPQPGTPCDTPSRPPNGQPPAENDEPRHPHAPPPLAGPTAPGWQYRAYLASPPCLLRPPPGRPPLRPHLDRPHLHRPPPNSTKASSTTTNPPPPYREGLPYHPMLRPQPPTYPPPVDVTRTGAANPAQPYSPPCSTHSPRAPRTAAPPGRKQRLVAIPDLSSGFVPTPPE
ncbi:hypothetical protein WJX73_001114 [Symbiochloris irregularis]|uniref:Uncharacterized protein n=1 Tax=Symbiochloris irregularis TaxID=706552 RepID=A0AAW1NSE0_9CHLO